MSPSSSDLQAQVDKIVAALDAKTQNFNPSSLASSTTNNAGTKINVTPQSLRQAASETSSPSLDAELRSKALLIADLLERTAIRLEKEKDQKQQQNQSPTVSSPTTKSELANNNSKNIPPVIDYSQFLTSSSSSSTKTDSFSKCSISDLEYKVVELDKKLALIKTLRAQVEARKQRISDLRNTTEKTMKTEELEEQSATTTKLLKDVEDLVNAKSWRTAATTLLFAERMASEAIIKSEPKFARMRKLIPVDFLEAAESQRNENVSGMSKMASTASVGEESSSNNGNNLNDDDYQNSGNNNANGGTSAGAKVDINDNDLDELLDELD